VPDWGGDDDAPGWDDEGGYPDDFDNRVDPPGGGGDDDAAGDDGQGGYESEEDDPPPAQPVSDVEDPPPPPPPPDPTPDPTPEPTPAPPDYGSQDDVYGNSVPLCADGTVATVNCMGVYCADPECVVLSDGTPYCSELCTGCPYLCDDELGLPTVVGVMGEYEALLPINSCGPPCAIDPEDDPCAEENEELVSQGFFCDWGGPGTCFIQNQGTPEEHCLCQMDAYIEVGFDVLSGQCVGTVPGMGYCPGEMVTVPPHPSDVPPGWACLQLDPP
jgi:hypothetical protein